MSNIDKVYNIWEDLEDSYQKIGKGSREDFLGSLLGVKDGKAHTEQLLAMLRKNFTETPENVSKLKFLEGKIEAALKVFVMLPGIEILDLEEALAQAAGVGAEEGGTVVEFDLQEMQADRDAYDKGLARILHSGCFMPCTYLCVDGSPRSFGMSLERDEGVQFTSVKEVTDFVLSVTSKVQNGESITGFCASVLAYLVQKIIDKTLLVPAAFVNRDFCEIKGTDLVCAGDRVYGCTAGNVELKGEETIKLVGGVSMHLDGRTVCGCIAEDQLAGKIPLIVTGGSML